MKCSLGSVWYGSLYCGRKTNVIETVGVYFAGLGQEKPHWISAVAVLENCLSGLGFDLVFASEMSRIEYMNYAEDNPI